MKLKTVSISQVDEVTQYEYVGAVSGNSERFLAPLLEALLSQFPFAVAAFHADNGSEYINHRVAKLLNKLHIQKFTKKMATAIAVLYVAGATLE